MAKYNWELIRRQYIFGIKDDNNIKKYPSIDDIVKIHGCAKSTIEERSSKEGWVEER